MAFLCQSELPHLLDNPMQSSSETRKFHDDSRDLDRIVGAAGGIWTRDQRLERPLCLSGLHHRSADTKVTISLFKAFGVRLRQ